MTQKRKYTRIDYETAVTLNIDGERKTGTTVNISQGGALLRATQSINYGQKIIMEIYLPKVKEICRISCVVRWCSQSDIGVQFEILRPLEVWAINQLNRKAKPLF